MTSKREGHTIRPLVVLVCTAALLPGDTLAFVSSQAQTQTSSSQTQAAKIPAEQLDSLVAPIALYPDPLLAQTLAASTYPLELIQLQQWLEKNKSLKDKALADAVEKQSWDPSIQALAGLPDVVKRLADDIQWTTDLGNAFLAQQADVMEAVQRMRKKAQEKGNLQTSEQQKVETKVIEGDSVILIEQANPQVIYVPSYNPMYVYGAPFYPYPPIYYPPAGYYAAGMAISFGVGIAMGAFWGGGGWGWGCGWGGNNVYINHNSNFNRNTNINGGNRNNIGGGNRNNIGNGNRNNIGSGNRPSNPIAGGGNRGDIGGGNRGDIGGGNRPSTLPAGGGAGDRWQHNPQHRGGAPYGDRATADRFGGSARGDSLANRQASARQQVGRQGGNLSSARGGTGVSNRASTGNRAGGAGGDRIGSRDVSRGGGGNRDAFGGGSRGSKGYNGSNARSGSSRGASSMGSRGGGMSRGGGSRGGGGRRR